MNTAHLARRVIPGSLMALARAATSGRPVRLVHRDGLPAPSHVEVEVLSVAWRFDRWVALARWCGDGGLRVLGLDRVEAVRPAERRRRPRGRTHGRPPRLDHPPASGVDPVEFALADLQDPDAGPARRVTVRLPRALAPLAGALFAGAQVDPGGLRVHLWATDLATLSRMVASLDARLD
jgi:proteasome accessory factor B